VSWSTAVAAAERELAAERRFGELQTSRADLAEQRYTEQHAALDAVLG
jgi:hypothetical protein